MLNKIHKEKIITIAAALFLTVILSIIILLMLGRRNVDNETYLPCLEEKPKLPYSLSLEPETLTATVGSEMKVDLVVSAFGEDINGLDAILFYDEKFLKVVRVEEVSSRFLIPRKLVESKKIIITALRQLYDDEPTSAETVASIYFKPLKKGQTEISFEFYEGKTVGSTIIKASGSENILSEVRGTVISIK